MSNGYKRVQIAQNNIRQLDWILNTYESQGVLLADAFQRDGIQNSDGARLSDKRKGWRCSIRVATTSMGQFLIIEDSGTSGLTGANLYVEDIQRRTNAGEKFSKDMRLARFSSMHNSGENQGGGLFGVGKSIYSVASSSYEYYFDSLREDGIYIASSNDKLQLLEKAHENDEAKKYIFDETGLEPKPEIGTRIIIKDPKQELVDAINSEEIVKHIQLVWWRIINRLDSSAAIIVGDSTIKTPSLPATKHKVESGTQNFQPGYRVKHLGIYITEDECGEWEGVYYYRKGMRIGKVDLPKDIPAKLRGKIWGFIEVDEQWESELAAIENNVHTGVIPTKKYSPSYKHLKEYIGQELRKLLVTHGYLKDEEHEDKRLQKELDKIAEEIQDLFESLGFDDLGKGPNKSDFEVRWRDVVFPVVGSSKVTTGDGISFGFSIKNNSRTQKEFMYTIRILDSENKFIYLVDKSAISIGAQQIQEFKQSIKIDSTVAKKGYKNTIELSVHAPGKKEVTKSIIFYFDTAEPEGMKEIFLKLHQCYFPRQESLRVNAGEALKSIVYSLFNRKNEGFKYKLTFKVYNTDDTEKKPIFPMREFTGAVSPFEDGHQIEAGDVLFDSAVMDKVMLEGTLGMRAQLSCMEKCKSYDKGAKVAQYDYIFYYNTDEKHGKKDAFKPQMKQDPDNHRRSFISADERIIYINVAHPAFIALSDQAQLQREYMKEQMLKQYALIYLQEGRFGMFGHGFEELGQIDACDRVIDKIEQIYFESLTR